MTAPSVHEAAKIFPLMNETDLKTLTDDIAANGLREPISLYGGKVLDGRNRLEACRRAGVEPAFSEASLNGVGPFEFVITRNLPSRGLSVPQRAALAAQILPKLQKQARARKSALARGETTLEDLPPELGPMGPAAGYAAELVGVARSTVERAAYLGKRNPQIIKRMRNGEFVSVNQALRAGGIVHRGHGAVDDLPVRQYGRGDRWHEVLRPMNLYIGGWRKKGFEFRHLNHTEARKRLKEIAAIEEGLAAIKADLEPRSVKATTRFVDPH